MQKRILPDQLEKLVGNTVKHYLNAERNVQKTINRTNWIKGKYGRYVCQLSHGSQQIKLYEPEKYRNEVNTPLRKRSIDIWRIAYDDPGPDIHTRIRELYCTYPYYLLKAEPVKLRIRNFYFSLLILKSEFISIYKCSAGPEPDPETDELCIRIEYDEKKTVDFSYQDDEEEWFYAVFEKYNRRSNILHFIWGDEI